MNEDAQTGECLDCKRNTYEMGEYYMILHDLWEKINPKIDGMLCIGCAEKRLKRKLTMSDFLFCPLNIDNYFGEGSARMRRRMSAEVWAMLHEEQTT